MRRHLLPTLLLLVACADAPPPRRPASAAPRADASAREGADRERLRELVGLSELVAVGTVERRLDEAGGTVYEVLVRELLRAGPGPGASHPHRVGTRIRVNSFLFRPGRPASAIRPLEELSRYLLFLSPAERPGEWLHLADPGEYRLPEAQATLDELRREAPGGGRETTTGAGD